MANQARNAREQYPGAAVVKRSRNSIHLETEPGRVTAVIGSGLFHLDNGTEIDTAWVSESVDGFQWGMSLSEYHARARSVFNAGGLVRFTHPASGAWVIYDPQSINWVDTNNSRSQIAIKQNVNATAGAGDDDDLLTWSGAYGSGRHLSYRCVPERLEKLITIDALSDLSTPPGYMIAPIWFEAEFTLSHSAGLDLYLDDALWTKANNERVKTAGAIEFRSGANTLFRMVAPFARDAAGGHSGGEYEVRNQSGTYYVTVRVPYTWLQAAVFPVEIDPSTDIAADMLSYNAVYGQNLTYATARSTSTDLNNRTAVSQASDYSVERSFIKFDTSSLSGYTVTQVNMKLTPTTDASDTDFDVQIVKQDWSAQDPIAADNREAAYDNCLSGTADDNIWRSTSGISVDTTYTSGNLATAWVSTTGTTYYSLRSSRDFSNTTPTGSESILFGEPDHATTAYRPVLVVVYTTPQYIRPDGDSSVGTWTTQADGTTSLYATIDETSASDTDYIKSVYNPSSAAYVATLGTPTNTPASDTGHVIKYRYKKEVTGSGKTIDLVVTLKQGVTTIKSWTHSGISTSWVTTTQTLTEGEAANITDYTDLTLTFSANAP